MIEVQRENSLGTNYSFPGLRQQPPEVREIPGALPIGGRVGVVGSSFRTLEQRDHSRDPEPYRAGDSGVEQLQKGQERGCDDEGTETLGSSEDSVRDRMELRVAAEVEPPGMRMEAYLERAHGKFLANRRAPSSATRAHHPILNGSRSVVFPGRSPLEW